MKKTTLTAAIITASIATGLVTASEIGDLTAFSSGTEISSSQVNGNFEAIKTAVNDNNTRLATAEGKIATLEGASSSCDAGMTQVGSVCVDNAEAAIADLTGCGLDGVGCTNLTYTVGDGTTPGANNVNWNQAAALCSAAGKRLPTNYEWTQAALAGASNATLAQFAAGQAEWVQDWVGTGTDGTAFAMNRGFQGNLSGTDYSGTYNAVLVNTAPNADVSGGPAFGFRCAKDL